MSDNPDLKYLLADFIIARVSARHRGEKGL